MPQYRQQQRGEDLWVVVEHLWDDVVYARTCAIFESPQVVHEVNERRHEFDVQVWGLCMVLPVSRVLQQLYHAGKLPIFYAHKVLLPSCLVLSSVSDGLSFII